MDDFLNGWTILGLMVGGLVALLLRYVVFQASCALVDVEPSRFKSIFVVLGAFTIALVIGAGTVFVGVLLFKPEQSTGLFVVWCILGLGTVWVILSLLYIPVIPVPLLKGFLLSGYEIVLGLLLNSLLAGIVLVVYAVYQIVTNTGGAGQTHTELMPPAPALTSSQLL